MIEQSDIEKSVNIGADPFPPSQAASFADNYTMKLQEQENQDNSMNKLVVKRELIAKAIKVQNKPIKQRQFTNPITAKVQKAKSIFELPSNVYMKVT